LLAAQRFEQYFTSDQHRSHFLRQLNGLWQTQQILVGNSDFFIVITLCQTQ
jgi:hypothetical protein